MTWHSPELKWAYDLGSMVQVSLLAFIVAGMAKASAYFDLSWQLMAICTLLQVIVSKQLIKSAGNEAAEPAPLLSRTEGAAIAHEYRGR